MKEKKILRSYRIRETLALFLKVKTLDMTIRHRAKGLTAGGLIDALDTFHDQALESGDISEECREVLQGIWRDSLNKAQKRWKDAIDG